MKKFIFLLTFLFVAVSAGAQTIYLKNGVVANGRIIDRNNTGVVMDVGGANITYYNDEIERIEEEGAAQAVSDAGAVAISAEKRQLILTFIDVFGTRASMKANFDQMMGSLSAEDGAKLREAFKVDEIIEALLPLYDKYFTEADLKAYIEFYGSANGKKLVSTIPQIMRGSVEVSAKYFEAHMPEQYKKAAEANNAPAAAK